MCTQKKISFFFIYLNIVTKFTITVTSMAVSLYQCISITVLGSVNKIENAKKK